MKDERKPLEIRMGPRICGGCGLILRDKGSIIGAPQPYGQTMYRDADEKHETFADCIRYLGDELRRVSASFVGPFVCPCASKKGWWRR